MRVPLIEGLLTEQLPSGTSLLVEYDPASQWYNASVTIAADCLNSGGRVVYGAAAQPPENVRSKLKRLGLNVEELEGTEQLQLWDWYTCQLGQKSNERYAHDSLKVPDLSVRLSKVLKSPAPVPEGLRILDDTSCLARFNDEKSWVEYVIARSIPVTAKKKVALIRGVMRGVHSEWVYRTLEAAHDGVIDFKLEETGGEIRNLMRIRTMRSVVYDARWHLLELGRNLEVRLRNTAGRMSKRKATRRLSRTRKTRSKTRRLRVYISAF